MALLVSYDVCASGSLLLLGQHEDEPDHWLLCSPHAKKFTHYMPFLAHWGEEV